MSIGVLGEGRGEYYIASVGHGVEDYYAGVGEAPGKWLGSACGSLGLAGRVEDDAFRAVLDGSDPRNGERLGRARNRRVPGYDLTFRAPKSVSLLFGLGDPDLRHEVVRAHEAAVAAALEYLEREAAVSRRGHNGTRRIATTGFIGAAFRHRSSRAGDPHLHTHVVAANLCQGSDAAWATLDGRQLFIHAKTGGYLYEAALRHELTRTLGVRWGPVRNGIADVAGIPEHILKEFSQRRAEITAHMTERGTSSARAAQVATLATRRPKDEHLDGAMLTADWRLRAAGLGFDPRSLDTLLHQDRVAPFRPRDQAAIFADLSGPNGLTARASSFDRRDVLRALCNRLPRGATVTDVERLADEYLNRPDVVALEGPAVGLLTTDVIRLGNGRVVPAANGARRYSTRELMTLETALVDHAVGRAREWTNTVEPLEVEKALRHHRYLSEEQREIVHCLTTSGHGVDVVVAPAGAGKTLALAAAADAWHGAGYHVVGAALAARAAQELEHAAGIPSRTIAGLVADFGRPDRGPLDSDTVLVVDEAGMVGTRTLARILVEARRHHSKVVLVGDSHQLPEIDAGGALAALAHRLDAIGLSENRRQIHGWEKLALGHWRDGCVDMAMHLYQAHGRVVTAPDGVDARDLMVADWHTGESSGTRAVMLAARRRDVDELNRRARALRAESGVLTGPELVAGGRAYQAGDWVMTLKNDYHLDVRNGTRGTVVAVDPSRRALTMETTTGATVMLPPHYVADGHLTHAYALTVHKAQGLTDQAALLLGSEDLYQELGYVGMSRGRASNRLYIQAPELDPERHGPSPDPGDPLTVMTRRLGVSRAQSLAIDSAAASPPAPRVDPPRGPELSL
ncbi:MAG: MobF family relaxase [Acidimicrobiia bacterium]